ncbi:ATP :tRNA-specific tRNA nucleotidyltransferase [Aspergillus sclerotioniger CBS 115572]|uniref:ATP:tRNA-specific tRNA nucleotidyltransferase n=1 Tax=Aspergillus sclerotioniger CBS 115572 TaxID=1450535 RepID=A0A317WKP4_9EURO|nr:ATP :tRNA-specific tRNA nucleotidyltransferase [Aspergillus sclerotioniger CBS 115572]PWY87066.1 ATP :tRNA-specific tRNA nucleotidyltransferase [Aspergillus sclerotioniger CBS 115572]
MTQPEYTLPIIQLTPLENTLKALLLDVAEYIREKAIGEGRSDAELTVLRFTGGWVRDKLLGVGSNDVDVGINNMTGYQFGLLLKEYMDMPENLEKYKQKNPNGEFKHSIASLHKIEANPEKSKHLETVTTRIFGLDIDLVNLRKETYSEDSRNPQMEFGTAQEDAMRRDATINALFYNLNEDKVEDLTGRGLEDMQKQIIRTPMEPYQTFQDDPLRVLRLIRFASRLGYDIDEETQAAMRNDYIGEALKLKISRERVGKEIEKMLQGPDPRGALQLIDRLGLYPTIFANHQDGAQADTSSWPLGYNALERIVNPRDDDPKAIIQHVREFLIRDKLETYYAWMIAAFAPWSSVPARVAKGPKAKPLPARTAEVARDSLRSDNKTMAVIGDAAFNWQAITDVKNSLLVGSMDGTAAEVRQQVGLHIRSWKKDWRLCILLAMLQEVMNGGDFIKVVEAYDRFISYIEERDLQDVYEMKPLVNGGDIVKAFGCKPGPWMSIATDMVVKWQLLHPEISDKEKALEELYKKSMEELRTAARDAIHRGGARIPDSLLANITVPEELESLWDNISPQTNIVDSTTSENLFLVREFLRLRSPKELSDSDENAANQIYAWAKKKESLVREDKLRSSLSISLISALDSLLPVYKAADVPDIILALASFTSEADPWTTEESRATSTELLERFNKATRSTPDASFWSILEVILKERIRPLFTKTRNPAITAAGRKDFHPIPLPRFDMSVLDPESKPWRAHDIYSVTVLSWIVVQYQPTDIKRLESHFPLVVPPILALIDDETMPYKTLGCTLLTHLLHPIQATQSTILQRTNLSSVFTDAIKPCLLSLPTITPEDDSIRILSAAYPALRLLLKTSYLAPSTTTTTSKATYQTHLTQTLRENLIPSFHHISTLTPTDNQQSALASFPHPRLSTLLLTQIHDTIIDLSIHTTKYPQEIIPLISNTLSNPFGTAHPPLLLAGVAVTRAVILNAHPRIWRWRGEILSAVCRCWLGVMDEISERQKQNSKVGDEDVLGKLKLELQGVVYLLRLALENPDEKMRGDVGVMEAKEGFGSEVKDLVDAEDGLRELLLGVVDGRDGKFFGV